MEALFKFGFVLFFILLQALAVQFLWDQSIAPMFGLMSLTFDQALSLLLLTGILLGKVKIEMGAKK